ncbi:MAG: hypothetical protein CL398_01140 [Acidiferrobacteraceae bacterium]|jgi:hypothetical protein|nr:hypothetical protein [Acidiferrobacteraceae bacterium]|tara:strand:+ start:1500 stop:1820 length:321 start_codon:yes stop_codon:yes gene_type:complete
MDLLYFVLCAFGITQIIVYGSIFDRIRPTCGEMGKLFHCTMCMGFWVGVFLLGINRYTELFTFEYNIVNFLLLGSLSSGTSYILSELFGDCGIKVSLNNSGGSENG